MIIKLESISNPGISFSEDVNLKLISLYEFIEKNRNLKMSYSEFQSNVINNKIFSGSYIRSFIPFIRNFGLINDYNIIHFNDFFTSIGRLYIENLINYYNIKTLHNEKIEKYLNKNKSDLLCLFLDYLCNNNNKFFDKYLDILYFVNRYSKICKNEFYIYQYCKNNKIDCDEMIKEYRKNPEQFEIIFIDKDNNEISNNSFNYFIALLSEEQCNYLCKTDQSYYIINQKRDFLIKSIIQQYIKNGG